MDELTQYSNIDLIRLLTVIESTEDAVITKQLDGTITSWNPAAERIFGYTEKEAVGQNISLIIPEKLESEEKAIIRKIKRGEKIERYITERVHKNGSIIPVRLIITSIRDEDGTIVGASKIARDINNLQQAAKKQALLAAIINSSDDAIISKDLNGVITSWNKAAETIFGYTEAEIIGKHVTTLIPTHRLDEETYIMNRIKNGKSVDHLQTIRKRKDGEEIPISLSVSPVIDHRNQIIGASKICRNISEQRKLEEKQALLASIISSADDAIVSKNTNGYITSWNIGAEKIFGYSEQEMLGKHINTIIPENRRDEEIQIISRIRNGERIEHFETVRVRKDGKPVNVSITVSPIINNRGEIIGASKIARNINDKIELERQLKQQNEKLQQLNNAKDEFIGMASHELKTPLTSITAFLQLLERNLTDTLNRKLVDKAIRHVRKLSSLVSDLLDVSKIEAGKLQLNPTSFILSELVHETIETVQTTITTHKIDFKCSADSSVVADRERIGQVIINLLTNAIKYSPDATEILVETSKTEDSVILNVRDYGIGISEDQIKHIFSRFYRAEGLKPTFPGLGIGLYISQEIVERHNGKMWVESEEGNGSTFSFKIPIQNPELELWQVEL